MADLSPIRVYIGDDWRVQVALVDTLGAAIDLDGATVGADFWPSFQAAAVDLGAAGGLTVAQIDPAIVVLSVPRAVTSGVAEQSVLQRAFPTRAQVYVIDSLGRRQTATLIPFQPLSPRTTDLPSAASVPTTVTAVLSPQGPAGPAIIPRDYRIAIAARGQTVIPLPVPPRLLSSLVLAVNGVDFRAPAIAATDIAVTWLNPDFALEPTDDVHLSYT